MNKIFISALLVLLVFSCQHQPNTNKPEQTQEQSLEVTDPGTVGGWLLQDLSSPIAQENIMVLQSLMEKTNPGVSLTKVRGVWTQVVAGYNARILAEYRKDSTKGILTAILYQDLEGNVFLKSLEL